ncbi:unnamed protein product [Discosporangium mesarthrocarpum]
MKAFFCITSNYYINYYIMKRITDLLYISTIIILVLLSSKFGLEVYLQYIEKVNLFEVQKMSQLADIAIRKAQELASIEEARQLSSLAYQTNSQSYNKIIQHMAQEK